MKAKLVKETLNFERTPQNVTSAMGLGKVAKIHKFFKESSVKPESCIIDDDLNVTVKGNLFLADHSQQTLPDNLTVEGWVDLSRCDLKELPKRFTVMGNLTLKYTEFLTTLPPDIKVIGNINLRGSAISSLPDNLNVPGFLNLEHTTRLYHLPENLTVGDNLLLVGSSVNKRNLPKSLKVKGKIKT